MSLTWLFLGAVIGVFNGLDTARGPEIVAMMLGGMIVLPIPGVLLGLIGADARGSLGGAVAGLAGCWLGTGGDATAVAPQIMGVMVVIGALWGATGFLFVRFLRWKYTMIFAAISWFLRLAPVPARARILAGHHLIARFPGITQVGSAGRTPHFWSPERLRRRNATSTGHAQ
jgi:hypothetical protein